MNDPIFLQATEYTTATLRL